MKRILFIAPHSYPIRSSESICNSKVAYTLAKSGYKVDVYTCLDGSTYPSDVKIDSILRNSPNLSITTVHGETMRRNMNKFKLLKLFIHYIYIYLKTGYYYNGIDHPFQIVKAIEAKIKDEGNLPYDVMITRGYHTDYVGIYMQKKYGLKWIANWNDPFPVLHFPEPYGRGCDSKLPFYEQKICDDIQKYAQFHTFPNERLRDYMLKCFPHVLKENTCVIHHMAHSELNIKKQISLNKFTLVHSGSVRRPRNPNNFLKALSQVVSQVDIEIECVFVGGYDDEVNDLVDKYGLKDVVSFKPSMTYSDSIQFLASAHMSLIIEAICEEGIYLPTKFVDALQCQTPVFCVSPVNGTLHDLVEKYPVGYFCDNTDPLDIEETLLNAILDFKKGALPNFKQSNVENFFENYILNQYKQIL